MNVERRRKGRERVAIAISRTSQLLDGPETPATVEAVDQASTTHPLPPVIKKRFMAKVTARQPKLLSAPPTRLLLTP